MNELRMQDVSATDVEDGNITNQILVTLDNVEMDKVGLHRFETVWPTLSATS